MITSFLQRGQLNKIIVKRWMSLPDVDKTKFQEASNATSTTPLIIKDSAKIPATKVTTPKDGSPKIGKVVINSTDETPKSAKKIVMAKKVNQKLKFN